MQAISFPILFMPIDTHRSPRHLLRHFLETTSFFSPRTLVLGERRGRRASLACSFPTSGLVRKARGKSFRIFCSNSAHCFAEMRPTGAFSAEYALPHRRGLKEQHREGLSETRHRLFSPVGKSTMFHEERASFIAVPLRGENPGMIVLANAETRLVLRVSLQTSEHEKRHDTDQIFRSSVRKGGRSGSRGSSTSALSRRVGGSPRGSTARQARRMRQPEAGESPAQSIKR